MTSFQLSQKNLLLLKNSLLNIPNAHPEGDLGNHLEQVYLNYQNHLNKFEEPLASILDERKGCIQFLSEAIVKAWRYGWKGNTDDAYKQFHEGLKSILNEFISVSRRHSAKFQVEQSWYRIAAWKDVKLRKDIFHTPFDLPQKSYRYSTPGMPTLYLANSVYLCWLECNKPPIDDCLVSRFEVDTQGFEYIDIHSNHRAYMIPLIIGVPGIHPPQVQGSPYIEDVLYELAEYLTIWPILMAVTIPKPNNIEHPPEYIISQLLMRWVQESDKFIGVRYFTSKDDQPTTSQDWSINLALPARTKKSSGYCDFLRMHTKCTEPQRLALMDKISITDLITKEAGDQRTEKAGRIWINWCNDNLEYNKTIFGKMEYWLDRPELKLEQIETN